MSRAPKCPQCGSSRINKCVSTDHGLEHEALGWARNNGITIQSLAVVESAAARVRR